MKSKPCQWCDKYFETAVAYQIYCSVDCREKATKEKIADRYVKTRASRRKGKIRLCKSCSSQLSIYNDDDICSSCFLVEKDVKKAIKDLRGLSNGKNIDDEPHK